MTNPDMIARLADLQEFAELTRHFDRERDEAVSKLGRKNFAAPHEHDSLEWERLNAYYRGIAAVLELPRKLRDKVAQ